METIPKEIKSEEFLKYFDYGEIIQLCQVNKDFNQVYESNETWKYLIYRDFRIVYDGDNSRTMYLSYKDGINYFSDFYPIITQKALKILLSISHWDSIKDGVKAWREFTGSLFPLILSVSEVEIISGEIITDKSTYTDSIKFNEKIKPIGHSRIVYPDFNKKVEELENGNCDEFRTLISHPTLIFINKKPMLIIYDYDLANDLLFHSNFICKDQFNDVEEEILSLIDQNISF
jgi:hypothetical protein